MKNLLTTIFVICLFIPFSVNANNDSGNIKAQSELDDANVFYGNSRLNHNKIKNFEIGSKRKIHLLNKMRNKNDNGFFVRDDFNLIMVDMGVNLLDYNIKRRTHWGIRSQDLVGYGYKISDASSVLLGLNIPGQTFKDKNEGYISFSVGSRW